MVSSCWPLGGSVMGANCPTDCGRRPHGQQGAIATGTIRAMNTPREIPCPLCDSRNETVLWQSPQARVLRVDDPAWPGFCRVVWTAHVAEMTDLAPTERRYLMDLVFGVESALRRVLSPAKINLASLGNQVPHLHWHVVPRFADDAAFPDAIWAPARRLGGARAVDEVALGRAIGAALGVAG
jgi:diadenosine tetraphosphate (Ap4A) HIT family hydrolase